MNRMPVLHRLLVATAILFLLAPLRLFAEPSGGAGDDLAALRRQVEALREAVQQLNRRVDVIEVELANRVPQAAANPSQPASASPPPGAPAAATDNSAAKGGNQALTPQTVSPSPEVPAAATGSSATTPADQALTPQIVENWRALREGMSPAQVRTLLGDPSRDFELSGQPVWYYYYTGVGGGSVMFSRGDGKVLSWQQPPFHGWW